MPRPFENNPTIIPNDTKAIPYDSERIQTIVVSATLAFYDEQKANAFKTFFSLPENVVQTFFHTEFYVSGRIKSISFFCAAPLLN